MTYTCVLEKYMNKTNLMFIFNYEMFIFHVYRCGFCRKKKPPHFSYLPKHDKVVPYIFGKLHFRTKSTLDKRERERECRIIKFHLHGFQVFNLERLPRLGINKSWREKKVCHAPPNHMKIRTHKSCKMFLRIRQSVLFSISLFFFVVDFFL